MVGPFEGIHCGTVSFGVPLEALPFWQSMSGKLKSLDNINSLVLANTMCQAKQFAIFLDTRSRVLYTLG